MFIDNVFLNIYYKYGKKKCNEKDKWFVIVGILCGNEKELFCCVILDGFMFYGM